MCENKIQIGGTNLIVSKYIDSRQALYEPRHEKPDFCLGENKGADQLRSNCEADQRLCFTTRIVQFVYFLNPKFPASSHLL